MSDTSAHANLIDGQWVSSSEIVMSRTPARPSEVVARHCIGNAGDDGAPALAAAKAQVHGWHGHGQSPDRRGQLPCPVRWSGGVLLSRSRAGPQRGRILHIGENRLCRRLMQAGKGGVGD